MAYRRQAAARGRPGRTIDFKQWLLLGGLNADVSSSVTFVGSGSLNFTVPATILRIRGEVDVSFLAAGLAAGDDSEVGYGLAVVSSDAAALGATALPDPFGDAEFPWLWWSTAQLFAPSADLGNGMTFRRLMIDTKAMRKVKPLESLVLIGQSSLNVGNAGVRHLFSRCRVLVGT